MIKLYIFIDGREYEALLKAAVMDLRDPKEEARFLMRYELERRELLEPARKTSTNSNKKDQNELLE